MKPTSDYALICTMSTVDRACRRTVVTVDWDGKVKFHNIPLGWPENEEFWIDTWKHKCVVFELTASDGSCFISMAAMIQHARDVASKLSREDRAVDLLREVSRTRNCSELHEVLKKVDDYLSNIT